MCKFHCPVDAITTPKIKSPKNAELIKNWANTYAEANGFKLNPDEKIVDTIIKGLLAKEEKQGKRYCPCRIAPVSENVCPCVYHKDEIEKDGACHCLFFIV
ncbi:MAG: ferredoxin:thioredoxin reductase [Candidatus Altiarchaeales archaeon HGW-Altiarchaeales-3]|nr:MAG: ferredoxin:thioredoxin reductase [Candidatus Altiarchaeales archaeon HGW-Altiarchaeales-3]